ncbi:type II toxin-antitoxin system ParD family antitoxin [Methylobacterium sp. J-070]|uniref:type II toxin-antitoxin system ParD family antitoxin n=1 Tax=Methylobacterium sp. J-070 TaxID=2836650 RepID=UPI001FBB6166|nr:type II toxin-antitoxin system ParD family antitoxin [Methylobacterium sp. J-070]MCJ2054018.1 type II toxin-antitoxin system ParD family antitoxin [Methylobacterium sp. J-070]
MAARETITISVPPELRAFLQGCVATGRYTSISEVVRAALREFERAEMSKAPITQQAMARRHPTSHDSA